VIWREKKQSSGGRLDILIKNPVDDSMYEVEIMLGATDESHIIRTIEYWDLEKKRWPQRQHYAILVAETITRRFFNVISLLSLSIPMMAIQVNMIEVNGQRSLQPIEAACQEKNLPLSPHKGALVCCKPAECAISPPFSLTRVLHGMALDTMICTIQPNGLCMGAYK